MRESRTYGSERVIQGNLYFYSLENLQKNKKGFTLIELLAIIVILAIIAVITVPIILSVIETAKKGSVIDSAYGYKDAVNNFSAEKLIEDTNFQLKGWYTFDKLNQLGLIVSGVIPTDDSWVHISNNVVNDYSLKFDNWVVNYDNETDSASISIGNLRENPSQYFLNNITEYYDTSNIRQNPVYYNPVDGILNCTEGTTNCMTWYKYSKNNDGTVNMILDHNTSVNIMWYMYDNNSKGPLTASEQLRLDTTDWLGIPSRCDKYKASWNNGTEDKTFIIDYNGERARLITAQEIAEITGASKSLENGGIGFDEHIKVGVNLFYFDGDTGDGTPEAKKWQKRTGSSTIESAYSWLFDNLTNCKMFGCRTNDTINTSNYGYWTSTPGAGSSVSAWHINTNGYLYKNVANNTSRGIRPVITILEN